MLPYIAYMDPMGRVDIEVTVNLQMSARTPMDS